MKFQNFAVIAAAGVALAGCATMVKSAKQDVGVVTPPVEGATCVLQNSRGSWTVVTPGAAHVLRSKDDMNVTCTKPGYQDAHVTIASDFNGATVGNAIAGGVVGIGVDAASGADFSYPHSFQIPMHPAASASSRPATATSVTSAIK